MEKIKFLGLTGVPTPKRPFSSESLYRLRYPDPIFGPEKDEITDIGANGLMKVFKIYCVLSIVRVIRLRTTRATGLVACMGFGWNGFQDLLTRGLTMVLASPCQRYLSTPKCTWCQYPDDYCLSSTHGDNPAINTGSCRLLGIDVSSPVSRISASEKS
jgi:hypothetical protein